MKTVTFPLPPIPEGTTIETYFDNLILEAEARLAILRHLRGRDDLQPGQVICGVADGGAERSHPGA